MVYELNLRFPDTDHVIVSFDGEDSGELSFTNPLTPKDRKDIQWYLEVYGVRSLGEPDDQEAGRIAGLLPVWGKALFNAVFADIAAGRLFDAFLRATDGARLLTISAEHPAILALPWELLHAPKGVFLFHENPRISIRRTVAGARGGRCAFNITPKERLHILFVVSRPKDQGFIDPRMDARAVLDALEEEVSGRFTWEFLHPATLDALVERLEDTRKPPVDILHFDGHGVFDRLGGLPERAAAKKGETHITIEYDVQKAKAAPTTMMSPPNTGYLLFETDDGEQDFISAEQLGDNLHRHNVGLIILSACQTAALGDNDEPMGSVAARLTATGIPAVLAMTHSVLIYTTKALFEKFYGELAHGRGIGESLDNARRFLTRHSKKYEIQRGTQRVWLELQDWFLPALYQSGTDQPMLKDASGQGQTATAPRLLTNLPPRPEAGFFGRRQELWDIERWFSGPTQRITLTGFGGQGKTALALEAGRWLTRTGQFRAAVFVNYARVQSRDAVAAAKNEIGSVLGETLHDSEAARTALARIPTLVILDNLEALAPEALCELLDSAVGWAQAGSSRVLCTTRKPEFDHPEYRVEGTRIHRRITLDGLGSPDKPDDALDWYAILMKLPPEPGVEPPSREELIKLFDLVRFHPLSIRVLAHQLKSRRPAELGKRLGQLLTAGEANSTAAKVVSEDTPAGLLASIQLSLDRLDDTVRQLLPRLGVFQGGACEGDLLAITEIDEQRWPALRRQLEDAALLEVVLIPGATVPFLRFHPTLAPMLWTQLPVDEQATLHAAHRKRYYAIANFLYHSDRQHPHATRTIALHELPNLLHAVYAALEANDPDGVIFVHCVNKFLINFGYKKESEILVARVQAATSEIGSESWYLAQLARGEQLAAMGHIAKASDVFSEILEKLGDTTSYERSVVLTHLARCFEAGGRPDLAAQYDLDAIAVLDGLEQMEGVKHHRALCLTDLADNLMLQGQYPEARKLYEKVLSVLDEFDDMRNIGAILGQLGWLAMLEGKLDEAQTCHNAAISLFQQLHEPASEATGWHHLGMVFEKTGQWEEAERHYRESARINEEHGNLVGAATNWNQLAYIFINAGKVDAAEMWLRKAIEGGRRNNNTFDLARYLNNYASFLLNNSNRLTEAWKQAEESLAIKQMLDPGAAEIWTTYDILANIAEKEGSLTSDDIVREERLAQARNYRCLARRTKWNYAGTRYELTKYAPLILATVFAVFKPENRQEFEEGLSLREKNGWINLVSALRRILAGERDADVLCEGLPLEASMVIKAILQGIEEPSAISDLMPEDDEGKESA